MREILGGLPNCRSGNFSVCEDHINPGKKIMKRFNGSIKIDPVFPLLKVFMNSNYLI